MNKIIYRITKFFSLFLILYAFVILGLMILSILQREQILQNFILLNPKEDIVEAKRILGTMVIKNFVSIIYFGIGGFYLFRLEKWAMFFISVPGVIFLTYNIINLILFASVGYQISSILIIDLFLSVIWGSFSLYILRNRDSFYKRFVKKVDFKELSKEILFKLREKLLINKEQVSDLEYTEGNYDDNGKLISEHISTLTTSLCEIGAHKNFLYFVVIVNSNSFSREFFKEIKSFKELNIYGLENFKENLYPKKDFSYKEFEEQIKKDEYLQLQFNFNILDDEIDKIFNEYIRIKKDLEKYKVKVVDQLKSMKKIKD